MDSRSLASQMQQLGLWPAADEDRRQVGSWLRQHANDVRAFARELLKRDLLTPYQANLLLTSKGDQLVLGPYVILERLGEGGMGQVYKARHNKLHRVVALKVIRPDRVANPVAVSRFFREVQAAALMDHPNLVRGFDAGQVGDRYYLAMQYVRGTDLSAHIKHRGPLPIKLACQFLRDAALGLQHIHEHGMVHRDIKPGNLVLAVEEVPTTLDAGGVAVRTAPTVLKILDLGLARLSEDETRADKNPQLALTHEGAVMGTVDYMAPEQARDSREADIRSDIYALGCTFYFALTAQAPFPGGTTIEKMLHHQLDEPAPVESFRPDVPPLLSAVLRRMMAKQPTLRYQAPAEVAATLAPLLGEAPAPAAPATPAAEEQTVSDTATTPTDEPLVILDPNKLHYRRGNPLLMYLGLAGAAVVLGTAALLFAVVVWLLKP
jgi:serine/threonine-protein kinase